MTRRSAFVTAGIIVGWAMLVILGVRLGDAGCTLWRQQREELSQAQDRLARLEGWLNMEDQVTARWKELLGPFATSPESDRDWMTLQGLQQVAKAQGLSVTELRPSQVRGDKQMPFLRLDVKVEGEREALGSFFQQLPDKIPGVHLEQLQLMPKEGSRVQCLFRLSLPGAER